MDLASSRQRPARARATGARRTAAVARQRRVSLCETLDRVLNKGAVIAGDIVISVADIDLLYLGVNLVVTSIETMRHWDADMRGKREVCAARGPEAASAEV